MPAGLPFARRWSELRHYIILGQSIPVMQNTRTDLSYYYALHSVTLWPRLSSISTYLPGVDGWPFTDALIGSEQISSSHDGLLQKTLAEDLCWIVPKAPLPPTRSFSQACLQRTCDELVTTVNYIYTSSSAPLLFPPPPNLFSPSIRWPMSPFKPLLSNRGRTRRCSLQVRLC